MSSDPTVARCAGCGSPIEHGQRYCLRCGERLGSHSPLLTALLRRVHLPRPGEDATSCTDQPTPPPRPFPSLPSPRISTLLVLLFLGFGVVLGLSAGSPAAGTLAASERPHLDLLLPAHSEPSSPSPASEAPSVTPASQPPPVSSSPTPQTGAEETTSTPEKPASKPTKQSSTPASSPTKKKSTPSSTSGSTSKLPPVKHVFLITLSDQAYAPTFGPESVAHYLAQTLEKRGELLVRYYAVAHEELANEIALISGQGPTAETAANCPSYTAITPTGSGADGQVLGTGCVYPKSTQTLISQLKEKKLSARAYVQGIDESGATAGVCAHPTLGAHDPSSEQSASTGPYATFRNPLVYFQSITESPDCATNDVGLGKLKSDLASVKSTPNFSYIVPDRCNDGNPTPCTAGAPAGLAPADDFLKSVVPEITASKAYKENGLLVITVDEAPSSGQFADSSSCCDQPLFPNDPAKTLSGAPRGGGTVGALLLSPFVKGASTSQEPYNHFSLLATIEDLFALKRLGYAGSSAVKAFEPAVFSAYKPS